MKKYQTTIFELVGENEINAFETKHFITTSPVEAEKLAIEDARKKKPEIKVYKVEVKEI